MPIRQRCGNVHKLLKYWINCGDRVKVGYEDLRDGLKDMIPGARDEWNSQWQDVYGGRRKPRRSTEKCCHLEIWRKMRSWKGDRSRYQEEKRRTGREHRSQRERECHGLERARTTMSNGTERRGKMRNGWKLLDIVLRKSMVTLNNVVSVVLDLLNF